MKQPTSSPERVLDILLLFRERGAALSVQDISRRFGTSRSSTYRYLQVLRTRGFIEETSVPGQFALGPAILALARMQSDQKSLAAIAEPLMRDLAATTGESVLLTRRTGSRVTVVSSIDSSQMIRVRIEAARNSPLHVGSFGKLHMAYLQPSELDALLTKPLEGAVSGETLDPAALRAELELIRRRGYASSESEVEPGMRSVSAPILGPGGNVIAALTLAAPSFRMPPPLLRTLIPRLIEAANAVSDTWAAESMAPPPTSLEAI